MSCETQTFDSLSFKFLIWFNLEYNGVSYFCHRPYLHLPIKAYIQAQTLPMKDNWDNGAKW